MSKLYTPEEVAEIWRVRYETVLRWIREGRIDAKPMGRSYRIPQEQVEAGCPQTNQ